MSFHIIILVAALIGGLLLIVAPFVSRLRSGANFLRTQVFLAGVVAVAWSIVRLYVVYSHDADATHSRLPWPQYWRLMMLSWNLAGSGITLVITMFINPQFHEWRRARRAKT